MTYYQMLGINNSASEACIRRAFRCKAKALHPDINSGLQAKRDFQLLNEAYQVLGNPQKRRVYDLRLTRQNHAIKIYYKNKHTQNIRSTSAKDCRHGSHSAGKQSRFEELFDRFLFLSMLFFGLSAVYFGVLRAIEKPDTSVNPYLGIVFGVLFTGLLLFGWDKMQRAEG